MRARAATGEERDRLWQRWVAIDPEHDSYAERRSTETLVVVLEPVQGDGPRPGRTARGAHITGSIRIAAPRERVFDVVAGSRNEPSFNPAMTQVELLTPEPVRLGSRFRARMGRPGTVMLVELTHFDRPHRLGSLTTSSMMETSGSLTFTQDADSTVMAWDWRVRPQGWFRALRPLVGPMGRRMERRIWTGLKRRLEADPETHTS